MHRIYIDPDNIQFYTGLIFTRTEIVTLQQLPSFMNCMRLKFIRITQFTREEFGNILKFLSVFTTYPDKSLSCKQGLSGKTMTSCIS